MKRTLTKEERSNLKFGFVPKWYLKGMIRVIKKAFSLGVRISAKKTEGSLYIGFSVPLNMSRDLDENLLQECIDTIYDLQDELKAMKS